MTFHAEWLDLRAPADARARRASTEGLIEALVSDPPPGPLEIVDLGGGSANNPLHLAPWIAEALPGVPQRWRIVDDDAALLDAARARAAGLPADVETVRADLASAPLDGVLAGAHVITASALIDLASTAWLERFAVACGDSRARHVLVALSVDGRVTWDPPVAGDALATAAFDIDMLRDKGFGIALGSAAPGVLGAALQRHGFRVAESTSDWDLGHAEGPLQSAYLDGVVDALRARPPADPGALTLDEWERGRRAALAAGTSRLRVGHIDLLARRES